MSRIILYIGGARSGKSRLAQERLAHSQKVIYIATAQAFDAEMTERIQRHQLDRPQHWETLEEPLDLAGALGRADGQRPDAILLDCLTIWLSNKMLQADIPWNANQEELILNELQKAIKVLQRSMLTRELVIVSNEVGCSVVPENALARNFRDLAGRANQLVACLADEVNWVVAGLIIRAK